MINILARSDAFSGIDKSTQMPTTHTMHTGQKPTANSKKRNENGQESLAVKTPA